MEMLQENLKKININMKITVMTPNENHTTRKSVTAKTILDMHNHKTTQIDGKMLFLEQDIIKMTHNEINAG